MVDQREIVDLIERITAALGDRTIKFVLGSGSTVMGCIEDPDVLAEAVVAALGMEQVGWVGIGGGFVYEDLDEDHMGLEPVYRLSHFGSTNARESTPYGPSQEAR